MGQIFDFSTGVASRTDLVKGACNVTRSGNTLTIKIPSKNVSVSMTANRQFGDSAPVNGISILTMFDTNDNLWQMTHQIANGSAYVTASMTIGDKNYTCITE